MLVLVCMTYGMVSIVKKMIRGKPYYYARECRRVDGKPKIVWQKYLGKAEDLVAAVTQPQPPTVVSTVVTQFGALAALFDLAQRLRLVEYIDRHVPPGRGPAGPSVGSYLLVATLNRIVEPRSKAQIAPWFEGTILRRLLDFRPEQLTSQRFWDQMDRVSAETIVAIERDLTVHLVKEFALDIRRVLFDATNFFTFIDTFNERCTLAQRGHSKEGRAALRIVGLALLVTADFHIPLCHHTYSGNQTDSPTFASLTDELIKRHDLLNTAVEEITLIFDKGNNSADNLQAVDASPYHFIGSLVNSQHPDLLKAPREHFRNLAEEGLPSVSTYRCKKEVFGKTRTIVVSYNEKLFVTQSRTLLREVAKRQRLLDDVQASLQRRHSGEVKKGKAPTVEGTRKKAQDILATKEMKELFEVEVRLANNLPVLSYRFREEAWQQMQTQRLGKTILFTDQDTWTDAQIVRGYRSQHHVEDAFRDLKNTEHLALRPQRHWTDQKIRVHVFYCVLALMLCGLLRRELHQKGIKRSLVAILEDLGQIQEVALAYAGPPDAAPSWQVTLTQCTKEQQALFDALDLGRYRSP
jgi:transposase